jgi:hypothetical protein
MVKKAKPALRATAAGKNKGRPKREGPDEEERILRAATTYLIRKVGGLLVATGLRAEQRQRGRRWIITVTLRYPTGHEGYIGDLLYDGEVFSFLTSADVRKERARRIEADPALQREWDAYRAATLQARKA